MNEMLLNCDHTSPPTVTVSRHQLLIMRLILRATTTSLVILAVASVVNPILFAFCLGGTGPKVRMETFNQPAKRADRVLAPVEALRAWGHSVEI